jgi:DNA (cytosine-5)-methyltransferase 1
MKHGSLFSGIGGFDLAAEWMGWENIFHCEWNEFGQKVLKYHFPKSISYADITKTDFTIHRGKIDILTGGFPCQPYSVAGKQRGKEDDRHLWPEMLRAIREIQPSWVVGENVLGILNWNGGLVFDEVQAELEAEGYEVQTYVLPAASINAPHKRDRVWFVANRSSERRNDRSDNRQKRQVQDHKYRDAEKNKPTGNGWECRTGEIREVRNVTNPDSARLQEERTEQQTARVIQSRKLSKNRKNGWEVFPTQTPVCDGDDGLSSKLDTITFPKWRAESVKAGGNAIVPQVAYQLFKTIDKMNTYERQGGF